MEKYATLPVVAGRLPEAIRDFLSRLLQSRLVEALFVLLPLPAENSVAPAIVSRAELLQIASPLAPVMPVNSAKLVSAITRLASSPQKLGVVLRPCELRALIELVKLKQASLTNLLLIGVDCPGTYSMSDYGKFAQEAASPAEEFLHKFQGGREDPLLRKACQVCEYPVPMNSDLTIGLIGVDFNQNVLIGSNTEAGEKVIKELQLPMTEVRDRETAIAKLVSRRTEKRKQFFQEIQTKVRGLDNLRATFARCVNCHNCKIACPLCYCQECFFDSSVFEFEAQKYLNWAQRRGALRMPTDTLLFHLTRLNHMATSCVGCGMCTEACPNNVPVFNLFRLVGDQLQKTFGYLPGRSLEDELPLATFKEEELTEVGI